VTVGTVDFSVDGVVVAAGVAVDAGGQAEISTSAVAVGSRAVVASVNGTPELETSSATVTQVVEEPDPNPDPDPDPNPNPDPDPTSTSTSTPTSTSTSSVLGGTGARPTPAPSADARAESVLPATGRSAATGVLAAAAMIVAGVLALVEARRRRHRFSSPESSVRQTRSHRGR
jgi:hypothetical protein